LPAPERPVTITKCMLGAVAARVTVAVDCGFGDSTMEILSVRAGAPRLVLLHNRRYGDTRCRATPVSRVLYRLQRRRPSLWCARHRAPRATCCGIRAGRPRRCRRSQLSCSGWGLPGRYLPAPPVRSYRTISPLPLALPRAAVCFCGTFLRVAPTSR